jgi:hypothetical protein
MPGIEPGPPGCSTLQSVFFCLFKQLLGQYLEYIMTFLTTTVHLEVPTEMTTNSMLPIFRVAELVNQETDRKLSFELQVL